MKSMVKKIGSIICVFALTVSLVGCNDSKDVEKKEEVHKEDQVAEVYNKELASYFPEVKGTVLNYFGSYEYGQTLTLDEIKGQGNERILSFKGQMNDASEGEGASEEDLLFEIEYTITNDLVKEVQKNKIRTHAQSIVREQTVLKLPLEEGNTWSQKVKIDGEEYTGETKIINVTKDEQGKNIVETELIIEGIEKYPDNKYKEVKIFKEGKGLFQFANTILIEGDEHQEDTSLDFGYVQYEEE